MNTKELYAAFQNNFKYKLPAFPAFYRRGGETLVNSY